MERQLFRAVCLTLLLGTVLSCVASETSEQKPAANFTTTIPKEGLERDVEQVFYLGPSSTLQVIDETGKAKYLPEPSISSDESLAESYPAAYRFENGACDFSKTVDFKAAFPGYTKPLWVADEKGSRASGEASSGGPVRYTFTNPPAECLSGVLSFCVRFKTVLAAGSDSATSSSTAGTTEDSEPSGPPGEAPGTGVPDTEGTEGGIQGPGTVTPGGGAGHDGPEPELEEEGKGDGATGKVDGSGSHSEASSTGHNDASAQQSSPTPDPHKANQKTEESLPMDPEKAVSSEPGQDGHDLESGDVGELLDSRLRRISETPVVNDAFLTIVVHSAARGFTGVLEALSVLLFVVASTLLPIS
ncbi:unnamed protein product [Neospora caninum Liverpool]|uniref:Toxoplasma gondii family A protein n=1 Tax=Neospora caninum (strain Liverpool) TaxID=572307 RepID=F0VRJ9_NEOCL|nr:uncharacterized protein NCLIV_067720 [Neospora caninum Liverpool]CBZ56347.1 unnamed protein product [Neospora caninum Liverpool]CEL71107.1 TPA: hypothetical protein BN1204_067720 [Neospora caninum Liverpool]|eukprot:XP_003886372.1 uncharacterized protein NCLIV_067720 [Neospora caninum Liverpool]